MANESLCQHNVWVENGKVRMANDDDSWYVQEFKTPAGVDVFIALLAAMRDECFAKREGGDGEYERDKQIERNTREPVRDVVAW